MVVWVRIILSHKTLEWNGEILPKNKSYGKRPWNPASLLQVWQELQQKFSFFSGITLIHPWNLTWNLKRSTWKRRFLLETIIFRFHVKFQGVYISSGQFIINPLLTWIFSAVLGSGFPLRKPNYLLGALKPTGGLVSVAINCLDLILNLSSTLRISIHWTKTRDVFFPPQKKFSGKLTQQ